jgi:hypothetical protein
MKRRTLVSVLVGVFWLAGLLVAVACGGGQGETPPASTVGETTPAAGGPSAEVPPTPAPRPEPAVDTDVPLVEFHSEDKGYSIAYPEGWEEDVGPTRYADAFLLNDGKRHIAQLTVVCKPGKPVETLLLEDAQRVSRFGGSIDRANAVPVDVAGVTGEQVTYSTNVSGLFVEHAVVYAFTGDCGWRIGLNTYGAGTLPAYLPLFERILATFQPD